MNERIRELQSKSYLLCRQIIDDDGHVVVTPDRWFDAFAELLIKECGYYADIFSAAGCPEDMDPTETKPSDYIKRQMRIEE